MALSLAILLLALLTNFLSFLRVFVLLETSLLVAGAYILSFDIASVSASTGEMFSALVILTLAGTEGALGLTLLISLSLNPRINERKQRGYSLWHIVRCCPRHFIPLGYKLCFC